MQTLEIADAVLKDDYRGPLRKQINDRVKFMAQLEKNTTDFVGRRAIVPCHVGRNTGVGSRKEGEVLPPAGAQKTVDAIITSKSHYGRIRLTKQVITQMASDRGAFVRAIKLETKGLVADCTVDHGRQAWGTSDGIIAQCGTTANSTTVQLATTTPEAMLIFLREGTSIDIGTTSVPDTIAADREVTAANLTNKTITISGASVTTTSSHFVSRAGAGGASTDQRELTGWQDLVGTAAVQGIDPSSYPAWESVVDDNGSTNRPFSENLVEKTSQRAENRSNMTASIAFAEDGVYRAIAAHLKAYQRIVNKETLRGGHAAISFAFGNDEDLKLTRDRHCPPNTLNGLAPESIVEFVDEDWTWEDEDGHVLRLSTDSTHTFEGIYYSFKELAVLQRNANWIINDLEEA